MELTLNKANRVLANLKQEIKKINALNSNFMYSTHDLNATASTLKRIASDGEAWKENTLTELSKLEKMSEDASNLKLELFKTNQSTGVSALLELISLKEQALTRKENLVTSWVRPDNTDEVVLPPDASYVRVKFALFDNIDNMKKQLVDDRKELNKLKDKLVHLNSTTVIDVSLSDATAELLGL